MHASLVASMTGKKGESGREGGKEKRREGGNEEREGERQ